MAFRQKPALAWFVGGAATMALLSLPIRDARRAAVESGQRSLIVQAEHQLAAHYALHGRYPDSLQGLQFEYTDGADAATLARLEYRTDGLYYRIVTPSDLDGTEISLCR